MPKNKNLVFFQHFRNSPSDIEKISINKRGFMISNFTFFGHRRILTKIFVLIEFPYYQPPALSIRVGVCFFFCFLFCFVLFFALDICPLLRNGINFGLCLTWWANISDRINHFRLTVTTSRRPHCVLEQAS